jgi:hypothetical protein
MIKPNIFRRMKQRSQIICYRISNSKKLRIGFLGICGSEGLTRIAKIYLKKLNKKELKKLPLSKPELLRIIYYSRIIFLFLFTFLIIYSLSKAISLKNLKKY